MSNGHFKYVLSELKSLAAKQVHYGARNYFQHLISQQERGIERAEDQRYEDRMIGVRRPDFFDDEIGRPDDD